MTTRKCIEISFFDTLYKLILVYERLLSRRASAAGLSFISSIIVLAYPLPKKQYLATWLCDLTFKIVLKIAHFCRKIGYFMNNNAYNVICESCFCCSKNDSRRIGKISFANNLKKYINYKLLTRFDPLSQCRCVYVI